MEADYTKDQLPLPFLEKGNPNKITRYRRQPTKEGNSRLKVLEDRVTHLEALLASLEAQLEMEDDENE